MKSRRNYYRLLRVQPDASLEIIKQCYRTLMQKLHHHPDLGGDEWNASHINMAYATLRDPKKRAAYDQILFKQQDVETLSRGHLGKTPKTFKIKQMQPGNQRNYYRRLQVQPDAELAIIEASYTLLKRDPKTNKENIDEAWNTLHNKVNRLRYDQHLQGAAAQANEANSTHTTQQPSSSQDQTNAQPTQKPHGATSDTKKEQAQHDTKHKKKSSPIPDCQPNHNTAHAYSTDRGQRCFFCNTPFTHADYAHRHDYCDECRSPLVSLTKGYEQLPRRSLARTKVQKPAAIYTTWPDQPNRAALSDLSATGVGFISKRPLAIGSFIKIDAEDFKAVAEIKYCKALGPFSKIGVRFITILFSRQRGSFVSTSV